MCFTALRPTPTPLTARCGRNFARAVTASGAKNLARRHGIGHTTCRPTPTGMTERCGRITNQALLVGAEYGVRVL